MQTIFIIDLGIPSPSDISSLLIPFRPYKPMYLNLKWEECLSYVPNAFARRGFISLNIGTLSIVDSKKSDPLKNLLHLRNMFLISVDITELTTSLDFFRAVWS